MWTINNNGQENGVHASSNPLSDVEMISSRPTTEMFQDEPEIPPSASELEKKIKGEKEERKLEKSTQEECLLESC